MKKSFLAVFLAMAMFCAPALAQDKQAEPLKAHNPIDQFIGSVWMNTVEGSKLAYLFGIESAIEVEALISEKSAERAARSGKKPGYTLSRFEKGWMEAFKNTTRAQMVQEIDKWYTDHPDELTRPVLAVIWNELILPRLGESR